MKKIILPVLLMLASVFSAKADDPTLTLNGSGTEADPWLITNQADLLQLSKACQSGETGALSGHYEGKYFKQTADIDMSGVKDFYGIGTAPKTLVSGTAHYFGGHYDGGNFRIKNLIMDCVVIDSVTGQINTKVSAGLSRKYNGLFGILKKGATVKNVIIDKSCKFIFLGNSAPVVGWMDSNSSINNCINEADVYSYDNAVGGILGYVYATAANQPTTQVNNCLNKGNIYGVGQNVGGIIGAATYVSVSGCANLGNVTGKHFDNKAQSINSINQKYYGGICGNASGFTMNNCWNGATIYANSEFVGGLAGMGRANNNIGKIERSLTIGSVISNASMRVGVVVGQNGYGTSATTDPTYPITFTSVFYDAQLSAAMGSGAGRGDGSSINAFNTTQLTAGRLPAGLTAANGWVANENYYPYLSIAGDDAKVPAAAFFTLDQGTTADFTGTGTLNNALSGMTFSLSSSSEYFTINGDKLTMKPNRAIVTDTVLIKYNDYVRPVLVSNWPAVPFEGSGTEASPYLISSKADIMSLMLMLNQKQEHYTGQYFKQTANIDMQRDDKFLGLATATGESNPSTIYYFDGTYDGGNFTISNMVTNTKGFDGTGKALGYFYGGYQNVGMFGSLGANAVVRNIKLDETCEIYGYDRVGGIAGYMVSGAQVLDCMMAGKVVSYHGDGGGIVGVAESPGDGTYPTKINNCLFTGSVEVNYQYGGGIIGWSKAHITNCVNAGSVKNYLFNAACTLVGNTGNTGGITGYNSGLIENCASYGDVYGYNNVGGISGLVNTYYKGGITRNCFTSSLVGCYPGQEGKMGSISGSIMITDNGGSTAMYSEMKAIYTDGQLSTSLPVSGAKHPSVHALNTQNLTTGTAIDSIASGFVFMKGYYPIPKALADKDEVKKAASVFFTLTPPQTLKGIESAAPINNTYPLEASLLIGKVFSIKDNNLVPGISDDLASDTLTLKIGNFSKVYPLVKLMSEFLPGEGTQDNPWVITSVADMNRVANMALINLESYAGKYFVLRADLDYTDEQLNPIGRTVPFAGNFDGRNHLIKNLSADANTNYQGLFGQTADGSMIQNIRFQGANLKGSGYVGLVTGSNRGMIRNIHVDATSIVEGVSTTGQVGNRGDYVGSVAGYNGSTGSIFDCTNRASVKGRFGIGGIMGYNSVGNTETDTARIESCINYGPITSTAEEGGSAYAGGIAGYWCGYMINCKNYGDVTADLGSYIGGLAGVIGSFSRLDSCVNYANVSTNAIAAGGIIGGTSLSGGIFGDKTTRNSELFHSANYGKVTAYQAAGGAIGYGSTRINIRQVANEAEITATNQYAGGLIGTSSGLADFKMNIENCYNTATIKAPMNVAGLIGYANSVGVNNVERSFNLGNIIQNIDPDSLSNTRSCAGGIGNGAMNVTNCYNAGNVTGWFQVGGILGRPLNSTAGTSVVNNCYNLGNIVAENPDAQQRYVGNILGNTQFTVTNCYTTNEYHKYNVDARVKATAVAPYELTEVDFGDAWVSNPICFPVLKGFENLDIVKVNSAYFRVPSQIVNEAYYGDITLSQLNGVTWSANSLLKIVNNIATPVDNGEAILTATCGDLTKQYVVKVTIENGVSTTEVSDIVSTEYYTLDGQRLEQPVNNALNIVVYITADGKRIVKKVWMK